ncbi:uncharacterized protein SOCE26_051880 [Sorangium cellulosum]|uniref:Uncharacterized protein n=1 Tax=Sorangium cellulosum TaxID=56 RepID=A0A2L0EWQ3_SORCE|nr:hypothetical protein [Sorangium cellulosum]AUX43734.1 uncharacterized protein SOCE26_051880 [Sorangium cellulosum]
MLLVTGEDPVLTEQVCDGLSQRSIAHSRVDAAHATAERGNLFQAALDARASGIVVIEPVAWRGATPQPSPSPSAALIAAALSATRAPGVTSLTLVTSRRDDDEGIRRVRRDGAPYIVLRPAPLFRVLPLGAERALRDRRVLIPPEVAESFKDAIPVEALLEAIASAVAGDTPQGKIIDIAASPDRSVLEVLARAGARPELTGGLRSRIGRWFGHPIAMVDGADLRIDGVPDEAVREAPRRAAAEAEALAAVGS